MASEPRAVVLSWVRHHGRSTGIAEALGVPALYEHHPSPWAPRRYAAQARGTVRALRRLDPDVVVVMLPPVVALVVVHTWARVRGRRVVADLHTGVFTDPRWRWATALTLRLLARPDRGAVVTNDELASRTRRAGVRTVVLHDLLPEPDADELRADEPAADEPGRGEPAADEPDGDPRCDARPFLLVPLSYAFDEPLDEFLGAARACPELRFACTGDAPDRIRAAAPPNVEFTGYVTTWHYRELLEGADAVVALTTQELTMQQAGYEALEAAKALVVSDTGVLRAYFGEAAVLVAPTVTALTEGFRRAVRDRALLEGRMRLLRRDQLIEQRAALVGLRRLLAGS